MTEDWRASLDKRQAVAVVAVDPSKVFDSINHSLLLAKLKAYGFSTSAMKLMSSNVWTVRKAQEAFSSYSEVESGVPQGSLLGPLLFNIFINDLNYSIQNISLRPYSEGTTGYTSDVSPTVLQFVINNDLKLLSNWFDENYLIVNSGKTQALVVGPCRYDYCPNLNGATIDISKSIKILGVIYFGQVSEL